MKKKGVPMMCTRSACGRKWDYKGTKRSTDELPAYITCPGCKTSVKAPMRTGR